METSNHQEEEEEEEETSSGSGGETTKVKFVPCTTCSEPGCSTSKQTTTITIKVITVVMKNEDGDSITNSFVETEVSPVVTTIETSDPSQIEIETTEYPQKPQQQPSSSQQQQPSSSSSSQQQQPSQQQQQQS